MPMKYDRIEIHFRTRKNEPRMVIIDSETDVRSIRLENTPPGTELPEARGLHIVGRVSLDDGPEVCYETPLGMVCW
jgi:hypothetical protein